MLRLTIVLVAALAAFASVLALALPLLERSRFASRLKAVTSRREELSRAQRASLKGQRRAQSRVVVMRAVIDKLKLQSLLTAKPLKARLTMAGWRSSSASLTYVFSRISAPIVLFVAAFAYTASLFSHLTFPVKLLILLCATGLGLYLPALMLTNAIQKRQFAIGRAFPDALDLMVICVDAGLSIEAAVSRTMEEMAESAPELS